MKANYWRGFLAVLVAWAMLAGIIGGILYAPATFLATLVVLFLVSISVSIFQVFAGID